MGSPQIHEMFQVTSWFEWCIVAYTWLPRDKGGENIQHTIRPLHVFNLGFTSARRPSILYVFYDIYIYTQYTGYTEILLLSFYVGNRFASR